MMSNAPSVWLTLIGIDGAQVGTLDRDNFSVMARSMRRFTESFYGFNLLSVLCIGELGAAFIKVCILSPQICLDRCSH